MDKPDLEWIKITQKRSIVIITLDRPEKLNAIDDIMRTELVAAIDWAGREDTVRAIILLSLIHISAPPRLGMISNADFY